MKKVVFPFLLSFLLISQKGRTQSPSNGENLKPYFFVLLKKGPHRDQDSATAAIIQKEHMENINRMAASGKLNVAGPFLDEGELLGIFIFDSGSKNEVEELVKQDAAVKAGRLTYEIHPWMTEKGTCFK